MSSAYLTRGRDQRTSEDADQAEAAAVKRGTASADEGMYDERVSSSLDDFEPGNPESKETWHTDDLRNDSASGAVLEELERRKKLLGACYPFSIDGNSLTYTPSRDLLYEFLLASCVAPNITKKPYTEIPRLFERIVGCVVAASFGKDAGFAHVGHPRDPAAGISFKDAMAKLAAKTGEWKWQPQEDIEASRTKDEGLDFVVWPPIWDGRQIAQLFVLGQCACGNDWDSKFDDLNLKKLGKWFNPLSVVEPIRAFSTPYHVVDAKLIDASREAGYIYDRARLVKINNKCPHTNITAAQLERMKFIVDLVLLK